MKILILGATGSIGKQTIDVINKLKYQLCGISFYKNDSGASKIKTPYKFSPINKKMSNVASYDELIIKSKPDIVVNAIVGFAGLEATLTAIKHKKTLCLANKESLVVAGQFVMRLAKLNHVHIYPIDSEHASLYQIIKQNPQDHFQKLYITASGGPFYKLTQQQKSNVTYSVATNHPTWKMGGKISIDSATMVNKCFEIIEAYWYFNTTEIEPLYHPQSFVHAIVKYKNKKIMFASKPDMHLPIHQAITGFKNKLPYVQPLINKYVLEVIDQKKWLPIKWAYDCLDSPKSSLPIIINAANEEAIELFRIKHIKFNEIVLLIGKAIKHFGCKDVKTLNNVYEVDKKVRNYIKKICLI